MQTTMKMDDDAPETVFAAPPRTKPAVARSARARRFWLAAAVALGGWVLLLLWQVLITSR